VTRKGKRGGGRLKTIYKRDRQPRENVKGQDRLKKNLTSKGNPLKRRRGGVSIKPRWGRGGVIRGKLHNSGTKSFTATQGKALERKKYDGCGGGGFFSPGGGGCNPRIATKAAEKRTLAQTREERGGGKASGKTLFKKEA